MAKQQQNMAQVGRDTLAMSVEEVIEQAHLRPQQIEQLTAVADTRYAQSQAAAAQYEQMMGRPRQLTAQESSIETMRQHYLYCAALGILNYTNVEPANYIGKTTEETAAAIVSKASARRRGAGARAVAQKYGDDAAWRITGHKVNR